VGINIFILCRKKVHPKGVLVLRALVPFGAGLYADRVTEHSCEKEINKGLYVFQDLRFF